MHPASCDVQHAAEDDLRRPMHQDHAGCSKWSERNQGFALRQRLGKISARSEFFGR